MARTASNSSRVTKFRSASQRSRRPFTAVSASSRAPCARHPSQLYEALLEGLLLGGLLVWLAWRRGALKVPGRISGLFFLGYGLARLAVEQVRQADAQFVTADNPFGHVLRLGEYGLTMGQILSLPMVAIGLALLVWSQRRRRA